MRTLFATACFVMIVGGFAPVVAAEELAPVGAQFEGLLKRFGLPDNEGSLVNTYATRLEITERDSEKFSGEIWLKDGEQKKGWKISGKITKQGGVTFTAVEDLSDDKAGDILGRVNCVGSLKEGKLRVKYTIPKSANKDKQKRKIPRFGTIELTLKEEE